MNENISYMCMIGCATCNYAPDGVRFYNKQHALAIIFHKQLIENDTAREVRARLDDENHTFADFFEKHQDHELVLIDHEGIRKPSIDEVSVTAVTYDQSIQN